MGNLYTAAPPLTAWLVSADFCFAGAAAAVVDGVVCLAGAAAAVVGDVVCRAGLGAAAAATGDCAVSDGGGSCGCGMDVLLGGPYLGLPCHPETQGERHF